MHTFFINTSKNKIIDDLEVLFDIHYENMSLVSLSCPISDWYDENKGYKACLKRMSELIDGYVELNNDFNIIVYVDLHDECKAYSANDDPKADHIRDAYAKDMHMLFTSMVKSLIFEELDSMGRVPKDVLIMFGEEKPYSKKGTNAGSKASDKDKCAIFFKMIGLSSDKEASEKNLETLAKNLYKNELKEYDGSEDKREDIFKSIQDRHTNDEKTLKSVSCLYHLREVASNKSLATLFRLNLAIYLLGCVENASIYEDENADPEKVRAFNSYSVDQFGKLLNGKKTNYENLFNELESNSKSYSELKMTPIFHEFDYYKFGLIESGEISEEIAEEVYTDKSNKNKKKKKAKKRIVKKETAYGPLLQKIEKMPDDNDDTKNNYGKLSPNEYKELAENERTKHSHYISKLRGHVIRVLSDYARSPEERDNMSLLKLGEYNYAKSESVTKDVLHTENLAETAKRSYETTIDRYFKFYEENLVEVTKLDRECDDFKFKIEQIEESLKRIKKVALGLLIAIIALYIPFFVIQFHEIIENFITVLVALGSFAVPVMTLYIIFVFVTRRQKKRCADEWKNFKEKSDNILQKNRRSVERYDRLLSTIIPALRWVYEYTLDLQYYRECCNTAGQKLAYHKVKLKKRVDAIKSIISWLDYNASESNSNEDTSVKSIDYNESFSDESNKDFYTVIKSQSLTNTN